MDYARVLLMVLWEDCCFLLMGMAVTAILLVPAIFIILLIVGRVHEGAAPLPTLLQGMLYGWFSGLVAFVGLFLLVALLKPTIAWGGDPLAAAVGLAVLLFPFICVVAAAQAFQYVEHHYNWREESRPRKRFAFRLRTLLILQVVLCVLIGCWATSRRDAISQHYRWMQLQRQEAGGSSR